MIVQRLEQKIFPGTEIPKPEAREIFTVKGWGKRRGQKALIYYVPNNEDPRKPHEKGVNVVEWELAYRELVRSGEITGDWFSQNLPKCAAEGYCNFTTIGGIFDLLGIAKYRDEAYVKTGSTLK
jgi:hypothetical protein